jgi:chromosome segregation ATPase
MVQPLREIRAMTGTLAERAADLFEDIATKADVRTIVREEIAPLIGRVDHAERRLDKVEDRLEKVEVRLENVEVRLEKVEHRLENVEVRLEKVEVRLGTVEHLTLGLIDAVNANTKSMEAVLTAHGIEVKLKRAKAAR